MSAAREKGQADFDLERFIDMFDEALTSEDERVVNALRSLMMMVILTKPEGRNANGDVGPLRQLFDDMHQLNRNFHDVSERLRRLENETRSDKGYYAKDYWERKTQYNWNAIDPNPLTMSEEDYKRISSALRNINTTGKI